MKQGSAQLLLNCPECKSHKLWFHRVSPVEMYVQCNECGYHRDDGFENLQEAADDWNNRET